MNSKQLSRKAKAEPQFHYYASTAFNWAVADTREKAIADVARHAGSDIIKRNIKGSGGLYVWSCRVLLPQSAHYTINNYTPTFIMQDGKSINVRVPFDRTMAGRIQNVRGHLVTIEPDEL